VRSAEYHKRARPFYTFSKSVIQEKGGRICEQYHQNRRTLYTSEKLAATPRLSPQEVSVCTVTSANKKHCVVSNGYINSYH